VEGAAATFTPAVDGGHRLRRRDAVEWRRPTSQVALPPQRQSLSHLAPATPALFPRCDRAAERPRATSRRREDLSDAQVDRTTPELAQGQQAQELSQTSRTKEARDGQEAKTPTCAALARRGSTCPDAEPEAEEAAEDLPRQVSLVFPVSLETGNALPARLRRSDVWPRHPRRAARTPVSHTGVRLQSDT